MKPDNKYRILIWIIVILIAINLSTVGSFYYQRLDESGVENSVQEEPGSIPGDQRTRFFREELNLDDNQLDQFREINRTFNHTARGIEMDLAQFREQLINILGSQNPDSMKLDNVAKDIGEKHMELKKVTTTFYLSMKKICSEEQQAKLHLIFKSMLNKESQVNLPQQGRQGGRWRNK